MIPIIAQETLLSYCWGTIYIYAEDGHMSTEGLVMQEVVPRSYQVSTHPMAHYGRTDIFADS